MSQFLFLLTLFLSPCAHVLYGEFVFEKLYRLVTRETFVPQQGGRGLLYYYFTGLLLYLVAVFSFACVHVPFSWASFLALCPAIWLSDRVNKWRALVSSPPSLHFCIWFTATLVLGLSLLSSVDGLQTPWRNNYGDFTWHLGIISSFVWGGNFPPQNPIFAGETLSYHFIINLWTATLWSISPRWTNLQWTFIYQWMLIWLAIFFLIDVKRYPLLPWALLFGGGTYQTVWQAWGIGNQAEFASYGSFAHDLINHGFPWTPFLSTIWVTQRSALFAVPILYLAVDLAHRAFFGRSEHAKQDLFAAGFLLGLSPLVHVHLCLVGVLYIFLLGLSLGIQRKLFEIRWFLYALFPAPIFLPWILSKRGIIKVSGAWMQESVYQAKGFWAAIGSGAELWFQNAFWWIALTIFVVFAAQRLVSGAVLLSLFLLGNCFQIAIWNWDEIKIFLALYVISLSIWETSNVPILRRAHWLLVLLMIPAIVEFGVTLSRYQLYTIYSPESLSLGEKLRFFSRPGDILASAPNHNSPITLTGRRMFYGFEGSLNSHGIDYLGRQSVFKNLENFKQCRKLSEYCPKYLLWTEQEKKYWGVESPGSEFVKTSLDGVYQFAPLP